MPTGKIKWFNNTKGWGFITPDEGTESIFVHFSAILSEGYRRLYSGQPVNYTIKTRENGSYAAEVIPESREKQEEKT